MPIHIYSHKHIYTTLTNKTYIYALSHTPSQKHIFTHTLMHTNTLSQTQCHNTHSTLTYALSYTLSHMHSCISNLPTHFHTHIVSHTHLQLIVFPALDLEVGFSSSVGEQAGGSHSGHKQQAYAGHAREGHPGKLERADPGSSLPAQHPHCSTPALTTPSLLTV